PVKRLLVVLLTTPSIALAQVAAPKLPERAIRRDIPMTNAIRRAHAAGTRDSSGAPGAKYWQLEADYTMSVKLDTVTSRLEGTARIVVHNRGPESLTQIALRLDPNHFRFNVPRAAPWVPAENTDGMSILSLKAAGKDVKLDGTASTTVPWLMNGQTTSARLRLIEPVPSGDSIALDVQWRHRLPGGPGQGHRMTQRWGDTLVQPTQWYPRVAKHDDLRMWDTELYLGPSEFYNNFGRFDVTIDVPAGWIVSGTGVLQNPDAVLTPQARARLAAALGSDSITTIVGPDESGPGKSTAAGDAYGRLRWRFVAERVNDFAWASARQFVWKTTRATIPTKGVVPIHMVHLPGRARQFANAGPITRHALEFYSKLWFPYPFPQLTLQDGPSAGMEYPMVINSNQGAADHETGHQWWPMVVGNNETWYGWMDEGFNQYMNILSDADAEGKPPLLDGLGQSYGQVSGNEAEPPMMWNANYAGPGFYGFTTYQKTPLMLSMLGGIVGDSAVQRAHREFALSWQFKHPSPWDWMFHMNRSLKRDLGWFWYYWLFTTERVDGAIESATVSKTAVSVVVRQDGQMPSPVVLRVTFDGAMPTLPKLTNVRQIDAQTIEAVWPVDVWFAGARRFTASIPVRGATVKEIVLDPGKRFPDANPADNTWRPAAK
ncbi:MAG: M1 family metallopeptidase, partial [Gemmatimonadaceae bacterium]|nr:M1 family metallopeptidase [Gemmatimonadaceae bacterium]